MKKTINEWIKANPWIYVVIVLLGGYFFGKDLALRDNARDLQQKSISEVSIPAIVANGVSGLKIPRQ